MKAPVNSRYAHCDGPTDITLYEASDEGKLLTCGSDGDIRLWKNPDDQDPLVFSASDSCLAISCYQNIAYVGTENNTVESFSLPSGKPQGVIVKFTAAVNHLDVSKKGNVLVAGSGDMTFQIVKLNQNGSAITTPPPTKISGHSAPVLSVLVDPLEEFIVSTGCDGCLCIWTLAGKQLKSLDNLFPSSNDILTSKTLCRPSWNSDGKLLAVPLKDQITILNRGDWEQVKVLKCPQSKMLSVCKFSPCGKFVAAGSTDGTLIVWNAESGKLVYENVDTKDHISGLIFSKSGKDIFAMDMKGRLIFVNDFNAAHETQDFDLDDELGDNHKQVVLDGAVAEHDPFDDDLDDDMLHNLDDEDDDHDPEANEFSISKIKAMNGFIASEKEDVYVGIDKARKMVGLKSDPVKGGFDDVMSETSMDGQPKTTERPHAPPIIMPYTVPQKPFQPSSSPEHLEHRFMLWNSIGIIRSYSLEDDDVDAIDIEFHDVSFHTAIHLRNQFEYNIAALGKEAVAFASPKKKDSRSKLMCLHFSSWDNNKEWSADLPKGEEISGLAVGTGWVAAATTENRLRIFSVGGLQKSVLEVGGQIIAVSGHEDLLFVTFHSGIGLHDNQCIAYSILRIRSGTGVFPLITNDPLPLSPRSKLAWVGFSDEGTPSFADTKESFRILNGRMWTTYLNMKEKLTGDSDHFWVTGASLCSQNVRVIKCKGTHYPPTLPRPTIMLLDAKIPLCEMETEKSQLEDSLLRSFMLNALTKKMDKKGYDIEDYKEKADMEIKENLMKLFAMCCKGERDYRAAEYVTMMPSTHSIQVAIKYANKLRKMALTDRLTAIGRKKLDEEEEGVEEDDDDFESMRVGNVIYSSVYSSVGNNEAGSQYTQQSFNASNTNQPSFDLGILEENPLLSRQRAEIRTILSTSVYKNPFKKDSDGGSSSCKPVSKKEEATKQENDDGKGLALIDAWKKPIDKPSMEFNPKHPKSKTSKKEKAAAAAEKDKKSDKNTPKNGKKQSTLAFQVKGKKSSEAPTNETESSLDNTDLADKVNSTMDIDINSEASETSEIEQLYVNDTPKQKKARPVKTPAEKRKRSDGEDDEDSNSNDSELKEDTEKKSRISSKLAAFAINRS